MQVAPKTKTAEAIVENLISAASKISDTRPRRLESYFSPPKVILYDLFHVQEQLATSREYSIN